MSSSSLNHHVFFDRAALLTTVLFIIAGTLVSVYRFWQYEVFYYNFGVFDQAIWHISRFQPPTIEHLLVSGRIILADHFDVSILLLAPLFWITTRSEILLVAQAAFAGAAGFFIYKIGWEVLKDKALAFAIACCYFLFVGIQNAIITDFQELTIMTLPVTLTFYTIIKKKIKLFWLFFLITLGFKEVTFLLGIGIAIFLFFYNKIWRKQAVFAAVVSIIWGYLAIKVFIPYFSQGLYLHWPDIPEGIFDKAYALVDHPLKRETLLYSGLQFGFLPLFAPGMWFLILQDYILRFLPKYHYTYWTLGLHYNAVVSTLLAISSIFGLRFLLKFKQISKIKYIIALLLLLNGLVLFRFIHHGPFLLAINPVFYKQTENFKFLDEMVAKIPKDASIMTQNNLGVRFTHQRFIYLRQNYDSFAPDYILIDNRPGQNPNVFLLGPPSIPDFIKKVQEDKMYTTIYHQGDQYIFKRKK